MSNTSFRTARWISAIALAGAAIGARRAFDCAKRRADPKRRQECAPAGDPGVGRRGRAARRGHVGRILRPPRSDRARRSPLARRRRRADRAFPRRRAGEAGRSAHHHRSRTLCGRGRARRGAGRRRRGARAAHQEGVDRGQQLQQSNSRAISQQRLDQRISAYREAEANLRAAQAALQSARLNLGYTEVRAPVAGRVGKLEITVGNLVAAGPGAPVLTTLVSVRSDLRELQRRRGSGDARAEGAGRRTAMRTRRSSASRCR